MINAVSGKFADDLYFRFQLHAELRVDGRLNAVDQPVHVAGSGPVDVDDKTGMLCADLCPPDAGAFQVCGFDQPAGVVTRWPFEHTAAGRIL